MRLIDVADATRSSVDRFGSQGVDIIPLVVTESGVTAADIAYIEPGGLLGQHAAPIWQLFVVVAGHGWVSGTDGVRHARGPGQGVVWEPGEEHASGSDEGLTAVIVEAAAPTARGLLALSLSQPRFSAPGSSGTRRADAGVHAEPRAGE